MKTTTEKKIASALSIISNAGIITLKLITGTISGSISIISEALHSISDFLASILTFFAVSRSSEPADKEHPFGHGKYEDMSGFIEGGLIIFAGLYIIYKATSKLIYGHNMNTETSLGIFVMGLSVLVNYIVSSYILQISKKTQSISLCADGMHLRTDIYSSLGILVGLILIKYTGIAILDPIIAIIVAIIIIISGYKISKETLNNLLDGSLPEEDMTRIESILKSNEEIKGYKNLRTRKSGKIKEIELTIFFDAELKICQCHLICDKIETLISEVLSNTRIIIHAEPVCYNSIECNSDNQSC